MIKNILKRICILGIILFIPILVLADNIAITVSVFSVPAPTDLTATVLSSSEIDLSWSTVTSSNSYNLYRNDSLLTNVSSAVYSDTGLSSDTSYTYYVTSLDAGSVESSSSTEVIAQTLVEESSGNTSMPSQRVIYKAAKKKQEKQSTLKPIYINRGEEVTDSQKVILYFRVKDAEYMAISNNPDFKSAEWEYYVPMKVWELEKGDGDKTVYVKFKKREGIISNVYFDIIALENDDEELYKRMIEIIKLMREDLDNYQTEGNQITIQDIQERKEIEEEIKEIVQEIKEEEVKEVPINIIKEEKKETDYSLIVIVSIFLLFIIIIVYMILK